MFSFYLPRSIFTIIHSQLRWNIFKRAALEDDASRRTNVFLFPRRPPHPTACADAAVFWLLRVDSLLDCVCASVVDDDPLAAAGAEAEADGVADVTKQLEKQAIEDKEKEEDGEEGDLS